MELAFSSRNFRYKSACGFADSPFSLSMAAVYSDSWTESLAVDGMEEVAMDGIIVSPMAIRVVH